MKDENSAAEKRERRGSSDFLLIDNTCLTKEPTLVSDPKAKAKPQSSRAAFGKVEPILSSGEWSPDDFVVPRLRKQSFFGRLVGLLYS